MKRILHEKLLEAQASVGRHNYWVKNFSLTLMPYFIFSKVMLSISFVDAYLLETDR
jgi:hypothetical protein